MGNVSITSKLQHLKAAPGTQADAVSAAAPTPLEAVSEDARKARTRRLIQLGALTDQYLETGNLEPEAAAQLLHRLAQLPEVQKALHDGQPWA